MTVGVKVSWEDDGHEYWVEQHEVIRWCDLGYGYLDAASRKQNAEASGGEVTNGSDAIERRPMGEIRSLMIFKTALINSWRHLNNGSMILWSPSSIQWLLLLLNRPELSGSFYYSSWPVWNLDILSYSPLRIGRHSDDDPLSLMKGRQVSAGLAHGKFIKIVAAGPSKIEKASFYLTSLCGYQIHCSCSEDRELHMWMIHVDDTCG
ncbi:hypothetical protein WAI453_006051 [Rhynchosporium graminicola]